MKIVWFRAADDDLGQIYGYYEAEVLYRRALAIREKVLVLSRRTTMRDWKAVRIWLHGELKAADGAAAG